MAGSQRRVRNQKTPASPSPRWGHIAAAASLLIGVGFGVYRQSPGFLDPYACNDDVRQQLYWMARFHEPTLFQNDLVADYAAHYVSAGVKALYWLLTFFWSPVLSGKLVAAGLFGLLAYWCCRIGEHLRGPAVGVAAAILVASSVPVADRMAGGNPRAFMFPLLAAWLSCLLRQQNRRLVIVAVASALLYPMAFVLAAPVWVIDALRFERWRPMLDRSRGRWLPTLLGLGIGGVALAAQHLSPDPRFGPLADRQRVLSDAAFRQGGRFAEVLGDGNTGLLDDVIDSAGAPLGRRGRWDGLSWQAGNQAWEAWAVAGVVGAWLAMAGLRLVPLPRAFVYLAVSSVATYGLAWLLLFRLFVPSRYVQYALPLLVLLGVALLLGAPLAWCRSRSAKSVASAAVVLAAVGVAYGLRLPRPPVPAINLARTASFWREIERVVPPDAVVAGFPTYLDGLGVFSRRKAFMPDELAHPAYVRYYDAIVVPRVRKTLDALFAERPEDVLRFAREEHVDYLLYGTRDLTPQGPLYIEPFNDQLRGLMNNGRLRCLLNIPRERVLASIFSGAGGNEVRLVRIGAGPGNAFGDEAATTDRAGEARK